MTNKLVIIINSIKVPKIKKILLYEMKFLVTNYSCLQNFWLGGYRPPDPLSLYPLSSTEFVDLPPLEQNSWVRHCWYAVCTHNISRSCAWEITFYYVEYVNRDGYIILKRTSENGSWSSWVKLSGPEQCPDW